MEKKINTDDLNLGRYAGELAKEVAPIYEFLEWEWNCEGVPDEYMIFDALVDRYNQLGEKVKACSSGGLTAEIVEDDGHKMVRLSFSIERMFDLT